MSADYDSFQSQFQELTIQRKYKPALAMVDDFITSGLEPQMIMTEVIAKTLQSLQTFDESPEASGYSSLTLLAIAKICDDAIQKLSPLLDTETIYKGTVVICTPLNDFHALGKTIVSAILRSSNWRVIDLGLSVETQAIIDAALQNSANYILISAFLLPSAFRCKEVADRLKAQKLTDRVKLIVGGPPFKFHLGLAQKIGADGMGVDAFDAIRVLNQMSGYDTMTPEKRAKTGRFRQFARRIFGLKSKGGK
jgi:methanogenic corrinoid protein MtbC1